MTSISRIIYLMKRALGTVLLLGATAFPTLAQVVGVGGKIIDTTKIYGERRDSLEATVFQARQSGNYLSKGKEIRTEVISSAGLRKLACCSLADSFENSASVTVGYSDAVTGARQIRLLGLAGSYTQMLDETRPIMRGISAPFGLSYVPGPWMESIQIAKGATSVTSGAESITGAINIEHRKPTDEKPLFLNASFMSDTKTDFNFASSLQLGEAWSTVLMGHVSGNFMTMDGNGDGFVDDPRQLQFNVSNRWLYFSQSGLAVRFGVKAVHDSRQGGELMSAEKDAWVSEIGNRQLGAYLKVGMPVGDAGSVAFIGDYTYQDMDASYWMRSYNGGQRSGYLNLMYQDELGEHGKFTVGLSGNYDHYMEFLESRISGFLSWTEGTYGVYRAKRTNYTSLLFGGPYAEYTYTMGEKFSAIAGLRADAYSSHGMKVVPRLTVKYSPNDQIVLRANAGRGMRYSSPYTDNIGMFSTNKAFSLELGHILEDAFIMGANGTLYFGESSSQYFSLDYFHTGFSEQQMSTYDNFWVYIYNLSSVDGGRSFTDNLQADLALEPFERFTVNATVRATRARMSMPDGSLVEKPMTSRYKGVLNVQYAARLNKWIFDASVSVNGPCKVYDFMKSELYPDGLTPVYPLLYLQITRRFKGFDIYAGGENLTGSRQKTLLIGDTKSPSFDASQVWGPIMGAKVYAGIRITVWKTTKD